MNLPLPDDPLSFIQECVRSRRMFWTYHVNMRMDRRSIARRTILDAVESYAIIESYPDDKYLPSYLVWMTLDGEFIHALFAVDVADRTVRVVTAYRPQPLEWTPDMKRRNPR